MLSNQTWGPNWGLSENSLDKKWRYSAIFWQFRGSPYLQSCPQTSIEWLFFIGFYVISIHIGTALSQHIRQFWGQVFRYAVATARASRDISADLRGALASVKVTHRAAITTPAEVGSLLRVIDGYEGHPITLTALRLLPHVFVRPGELRHAEWSEFDFDKAVWIIPAHKMKMQREYRVPLSRQALAILAGIEHDASLSPLLFPSLRSARRPMSENTINGALRRLGYAQTEMTAHGFRAMASTLLNEMGKWNPDAIERQLAHADGNAVRRAYSRGQYWAERVAMMQDWSDYLDQLRDGAWVLRPSFTRHVSS